MTTPADARLHDACALLEAGQYAQVITLLTAPRLPTCAGSWRTLGLAQLRAGQYQQAELPLLRAGALGDQEAQVEYGNMLRALGQFGEACAHFEELHPSLSGELAWRALRWWGTAAFQAGDTAAGLARCERAWYGYMALGDDELIGRVTQTLAQMHLQVGNPARAAHLYGEAVHLLPRERTPVARLSALRGLANVQLSMGQLEAARGTLATARRDLALTDALHPRAHLLSVEAELHRLSGHPARYADTLLELQGLVPDLQDFELLIWTASRLADHHSLHGNHGRALEVLYDLAPDAEHPTIVATRGVLLRRRHQYAAAVADLRRALSLPLGEGQRVRALLHLADAHAKNGDADASAQVLRAAMDALLVSRERALYQPDMQELGDLVQHALLDPDLAPQMELVQDSFAALTGLAPAPEDALIHLQVQTLGRVAVAHSGEAVTFSLEGSVLTLTYLALHPNQTRRELEAALYPDRDPNTTGDYFRQVFRELRAKLGQQVLQLDGSPKQPRYRLGAGVHLDLDVAHLREALGRGDVARALALYRGPFLPDLKMESEWAAELREELRLNLAFELRVRLDRARADGELKRALLLANQYLRVDPYEREVLEERVEVARMVAPPQDLARYVVELNRMLN